MDEPVRLENETLYALIEAMAAPTLERVLAGVVRLLTQTTDCHACFVYLRAGEMLRLRAASTLYAHLVGQLEMAIDEGVTGWVARNARPTFIRENALEDPRMKYFPELEEERFQSMCAVPVLATSGEVIGVIVLHTAAPREFSEDVMTFLEHTASLLAGPLDNARLYEQTRKRVARLEALSRLGEQLAEANGRDQMAATVTKGMRRLLGAAGCRLYLKQAPSGRLELAASDPADDAPAMPEEEVAALLLEAVGRAPGQRREGGGGALAAPLISAGERVGVLGVLGVPDGREEHELLRTVAHQLNLALEKAALIEQLTAENVVRDLFEALEAGKEDLVETRARAAAWRPAREAAILVAEQLPRAQIPQGGPIAPRAWRPACGAGPGNARGDRQPHAAGARPASIRREQPSWGRLQESLDELAREHEVAIGLSEPRNGLEGGRLGLREAERRVADRPRAAAGRGRAVLRAARCLQVPRARAAG